MSLTAGAKILGTTRLNFLKAFLLGRNPSRDAIRKMRWKKGRPPLEQTIPEHARTWLLSTRTLAS